MDFAKDVVPIRIEDEMRNSYMDYSMSVIIGRALPDIRDGLKPVHRRILYAMDREGLASNKKYSKCAGVVGEVLKKYHPHGDSAVYDALVRMAQPWNLRYMLVDGQGNFGSVDGDPAAAYRYTECRMTKLAEEMLTDIDKETVTYSDNFDGQVQEPDVLPARFPNLLVNGADGIAVGMATKIPPHNLVEVINACVHIIENPEADLDDIMEFIPGPDFPTGGTIYGRKGVRDAYSTGRGRVVVRGRAEFEELKNGRTAIIIDELPFQVNKARLIKQIADLVKDKRIDGIHALRDESDRTGMRVVIELKFDAFEEVVLNHLYKHTYLQSTFGVILLAIVNKRPRVLTLREMITLYISHRRDVILRRTRYLLRKAKERAHILEGFKIALDWLDEVIALIRASQTTQEAREGLQGRFDLTEIQANAILEMRLQRLTGMERQKILEELQTVLATISELEDILESEVRLMGVVKAELIEVRDQYGDERRTRIVDDLGELSIHDLVAEEDHIVTVSHLGYIKRVHPDEWRAQRRGGMGKKGMSTRDEDYVTNIFVANTHNQLMVFTTSGIVYPLPVYQIPETSRTAKGRPIINLVPVGKDEKITAVVSVPEITEESTSDLLFVSRQGLVKKTPLSDYRNIRTSGLIACGVAEDDELQIVKELPHDSDCDVMIFSANGQSIRFKRESDPDKSNGVPSYGRTARGNKGIALDDGDYVVQALLVPSERVKPPTEEEYKALDADELAEMPTVLTVTALGYGKRNPFEEWGTQNRNGKGVIGHKLSDKTGVIASALVVDPGDHLMVVTDTGRVIRFEADSVSTYKRSTQGVRLMRLEDNERIVDVTRIVDEEDEDEDGVESEEDEDDASDATDASEESESTDTPGDDDSESDED